MSEGGVIVKGIGSFYYVMTTEDETVRCRLRGNFRHSGITPTVGDKVTFVREKEGDAVITELGKRTNALTRPFIANAEIGVVVVSLTDPEISFTLTDKMLIQNMHNSLECVLAVNKCDTADKLKLAEVAEVYASSGVELFFVSALTGEGIQKLKDRLTGCISVFSGVSGSGKSSLINAIANRKISETGEISRKLKRGKNTTRHSELICFARNSYLCDTPGFSSFVLFGLDKDDIWKYYREFEPYSNCRFSTCMHINEPECMVKEAVKNGKINKKRYENYLFLYREAKKNAAKTR